MLLNNPVHYARKGKLSGWVVEVILLLTLFQVQAQDSTSEEVEIINADLLRMMEMNGKSLTMLSGNVALRQNGVLLNCDSALLDRQTNDIDAYGNVRIVKDSVVATSRLLHHDGLSRLATLIGDVRLTDRHMLLKNDLLYYRMQDHVAYYLNGANITRGASTKIKSVRGYYFSNTEQIFFKDRVDIVDSAYHLTGDSLMYHTETEKSVFFGKTRIEHRQGTIDCTSGWYDARNGLSAFGKGTVINNPPTRLECDTIYYNRNKGVAYLPEFFHSTDSSKNTQIFANRGYYEADREYLLATRNPLMIIENGKDSLLLIADTLLTERKTGKDSIREFHAFSHVLLHSAELNGKCDSLAYSFSDSTFRFFGMPVLWSKGTQITGDTMYLRTRMQKPDRLWVIRNAFIFSVSSAEIFDQVSGANMETWFDSSKIEKVWVTGSAESLYFGKEDNGKYLGANHANCDNMWLHFKKGKMSKIVFVQKPKAVFTPMKMLTTEQYLLNGMVNRSGEEPKEPGMFLNHPFLR